MFRTLDQLGVAAIHRINGFGDFCRFCGRTFAWMFASLKRLSAFRLMMVQFFEIGTKSLPVVMTTGAFVGMVLAVQAVPQFEAVGLIASMGALVNLSVLRELGPVLAGVMLAGRVGGGLTAELGTMRVTEQIDALKAMGASPIRVLVVPRFVACVLLTPILVVYADIMGILGGFGISVMVYGVDPAEFWRSASDTIRTFDILYGLIKSLSFGVALGLISCYKGFRCSAGAAGVGRACTEAFVVSCMSILALDFFLGMLMNTIYEFIYGVELIL
jgi:phospholipid/cholesterol/gamma-HCH transport system permease protein